MLCEIARNQRCERPRYRRDTGENPLKGNKLLDDAFSPRELASVLQRALNKRTGFSSCIIARHRSDLRGSGEGRSDLVCAL